MLEGRTVIGAGSVIGPTRASSTRSVGARTSRSRAPSCASRRSATAAPSGRSRTCAPAPASPPGCQVGAFVETKNADIGEGAKVPHLAYVGDADVGAARQHRLRHDHRELRRREQAPHDDRRRRAHRLQLGARRAGDGRATAPRSAAGAVVTSRRAAGRAGEGRAGPLHASGYTRREAARCDAPTPTAWAPMECSSSPEKTSRARGRAGAIASSRTRSPTASTVPLSEVVLVDVRERRDLLPATARASAAATCSCSRATAIRSTTGIMEQLHHDRRRRSARRRSASPRCAPSTATRARTARPRAASRSRRGSSPTCSSAAGADRVVSASTCTPGQIQGFFDFPVDHLTAVPVIADYLAARSRRRGHGRVARRRRRQARAPLRDPARGTTPVSMSSSRSSTSAGRRARTTSRWPPRWSARSKGRTACSSTT